MILILASANKGKIKELRNLVPFFDVVAYTQILGDIDIIEDGDSFKANAIIKVQAVQKELEKINYNKTYIILSDDSGITVPALNSEPNIYSARYAGINATDKQNNQKLIDNLKKNNISKTPAYYTACLALWDNHNIYTTHGWMHGDVIDKEVGNNGFGYDPLFIPKGFYKTLGELDYDIKKDFSHRTKALDLMKIILDDKFIKFKI